MKDKICANCKYRSEYSRECHRFPPQPFPYGTSAGLWQRPEVNDNSWCGEWKSNEEQLNG